MLALGDVVEIHITDLLANGQGVGRAGDLVVFCSGPLPGESARVRITAVKAKYAVGDVVAMLDPSAHRVLPFCPVFGRCGGCQVQHLSYPAQLEWKRAMVESALRRIGGIDDARVGAAIGMDEPRHYRNKMSLVVRHAGAGIEFGFYEARSHDVVAVHECPVVDPRLDHIIAALWRAASGALGAFTGARHVVARVGTAPEQAVVSITTDRRSETLATEAPELARALGGASGIVNSYDPSSANAVLGRRVVALEGCPEIEAEIGGVRFRVSAASFFQINTGMVARIFDFLLPMVVDGMRVVDLYCGAGTFALFFAKLGARVTGVEENAGAVREARGNAERNRLDAAFLAGLVERAVRAGPVARALTAADVVFLDPPRRGSDALTLGTIAAARVPAVWYLSCNPATLARDLRNLVGAGYTVQGVQPFDMFPHTGHVEALALLRLPGASARRAPA